MSLSTPPDHQLGVLFSSLSYPSRIQSVLSNGRVVETSLSPYLGAPRMVTQDLHYADVCFNWSCHHRAGVIFLSLPLSYPSQAYAPVFSWHHLLSLLKRHDRSVFPMSKVGYLSSQVDPSQFGVICCVYSRVTSDQCQSLFPSTMCYLSRQVDPSRSVALSLHLRISVYLVNPTQLQHGVAPSRCLCIGLQGDLSDSILCF